MAMPTIQDDITRIEAELTALRNKISEQEALRGIEEGGAGARFRTDFTDIDKLYVRASRLEAKLNTLYLYLPRRSV